MVKLSIGNAGASFDVEQTEYGPEIVIKSSAMGNLQSEMRIRTSEKGLMLLASFLKERSENVLPYKVGYHQALPVKD